MRFFALRKFSITRRTQNRSFSCGDIRMVLHFVGGYHHTICILFSRSSINKYWFVAGTNRNANFVLISCSILPGPLITTSCGWLATSSHNRVVVHRITGRTVAFDYTGNGILIFFPRRVVWSILWFQIWKISVADHSLADLWCWLFFCAKEEKFMKSNEACTIVLSYST